MMLIRKTLSADKGDFCQIGNIIKIPKIKITESIKGERRSLDNRHSRGDRRRKRIQVSDDTNERIDD